MKRQSTKGRIMYNEFVNNISKYEGQGLNSDEIIEIKEAFDFIDNNESGSISREEFIVARNMMKFGDNNDEEGNDVFNEMINKMDNDKSGSINFDEFIKIFTNEKEKKMSNKDYFRDLFMLFTGEEKSTRQKLNFKDLQNIVAMIEEDISLDELKEMFVRADADKDGFVGIEEFVAFMDSA